MLMRSIANRARESGRALPLRTMSADGAPAGGRGEGVAVAVGVAAATGVGTGVAVEAGSGDLGAGTGEPSGSRVRVIDVAPANPLGMVALNCSMRTRAPRR